MNELQIFESNQFGQVRTIFRDNEPWFVAVDVCRALEIGNSRMAVDRLDEDEKNTVSLTDGNSGKQEMSFIPEGDVYRLIARSKLPAAEENQHKHTARGFLGRVRVIPRAFPLASSIRPLTSPCQLSEGR